MGGPATCNLLRMSSTFLYNFLHRLTLRTRTTTTYVIFTAYSITTAYFSNGVCTTILGGPITLPTPYSILKPATPFDTDLFRSSARLRFQNYLGLSGCTAGETSATPTASVQVVLTTDAKGALPVHLSTLIPSTNSTSQLRQSASAASSQATSTNLGSEVSRPTGSSLQDRSASVKINIGVILPLSIIALLLICSLLTFAVFRFKRCARRRKACSSDRIGSKKDSPPYFQQKSELHGDECRYEMPAEHKRHEVEAEEMRHQLQADERLELEACHSRHELEAPVSF